MLRWGWLAAVLLLTPSVAQAEWQIRPFIGFTFGGATTFVDPERATETQNAVVGVTAGWLGEIIGFEGDLGRAPGFFETDRFRDPQVESLITSSAVTTLTGNVVIALPRRIAGYGLRPYFSGGAGLMHVDAVGRFEVIEHHRTLPTLSLGGGVTGFLTDAVGVNWDVRRINTLRGEGETLGNSVGRERLSYWRATIAIVLR